ncbi:DUF309 domain-containing protein [[Limnothrix rosea] IAM M-220]|uniref:DUF309 domain-containing protein n=1 Tax=[Limnothrix rosea] IAM M-220 TaxID=454133 RepID=UPI000960ACC1|nr:DUF309 domain-containing protein [[Limnothrix rosea] IAM M-220]OKH17756.1 hypothetical protein NIES208_08000 [[Limnothrix rosea] IAM M-220]
MEVPASFFDGVRQLNEQEFYCCHDTFEALWFEAMEPEKSLYQGILQVAVGCYHLGNHNLRGATILVGEGLRRLRKSGEEVYAGFDIVDFIEKSDRLLSQLQYLDPDDIETFATDIAHRSAFPKLKEIVTD